jgi:predicted RNase H-like nuclease
VNVLGVDGTREGWAVVACKEGQMRVRRIARLADILSIPLSRHYEARHDLGPRGSSVFVPPVRAVLNARPWEEACAIAREF